MRGFIRADKLFEYARVRCGFIRSSIFVKCPRCGKIGRLRRAGRGKYRVMHSRYGGQACTFGYNAPEWDYLDRIYRMYRG